MSENNVNESLISVNHLNFNEEYRSFIVLGMFLSISIMARLSSSIMARLSSSIMARPNK